jgi:ribosome-binding factor A
MVSLGRSERIAKRIKEELSLLLLFELNDPRLAGANITDVRVDREIAYANIFVSAVEGSERAEEVIEGLQHASGFIRHLLAQKIQLRQFPQLRFNWDPTPEHAQRIDRLLDSLEDGPESGSDG